jgi:type IV pilus assembly protein PilQ
MDLARRLSTIGRFISIREADYRDRPRALRIASTSAFSILRGEMKTMISRRLFATLALLALLNNLWVFAQPNPGVNPAPEGQAFTLVSIKHETVGAMTRVLIESNAPPLYAVFRPTEDTLVVDLPGADASQLAPEYAVKSGTVDSIIVRKSRTNSAGGRPAARIEIGVRPNVRDRSVVNGNTLVIELMGEQSRASSSLDSRETRDARRANATVQDAPGVYVQPLPVSARANSSDARPRVEARPAVLRAATLVRSVRTEIATGAVRVLVDADGVPQFNDFVLENPWRVIVDITGVRSGVGNKAFVVGEASVNRVRVGQPSNNVVRIVLDTQSRIPYQVQRDGSQLLINVGAVGSPKSAQDQKAAASEVSQNIKGAAQSDSTTSEVKVAGARLSEQKQPGSKTATGANPAQSTQKGKSSATGSRPAAGATSGKPGKPAASQPGLTKEAPTQPVPGANRSYTDAQKQPSAAVVRPSRARSEMAFCDPSYVGGLISFDLRAGVDLKDMLRFISQQYGVNFIVDKSVGAVPVDIRVTDIPWNQVMESVLKANRLGAVCEGSIIRIATLIAVKEEEEQRRQLREEQQKKEPLVTEIVKLRYARAIGLLGQTGSGASGRSGGGASASGGAGAGGAGGQSGKVGLMAIANSRLSQRGKIEVDPRTNSMIITDLPDHVATVKAIINQLDKPEAQVEIEARIVIASRNFLRDIGTELGGAAYRTGNGATGYLSTSPLQFNPGGGLAPGGPGATGGSSGSSGSSGSDSGSSGSQNKNSPGPNLTGPIPTTALRNGLANTVLSLTTGLIGTSIISAALSASETKGQIRTIASPRITAQDNQTAEIVNGVQIPVQTVSNNTVTTTFVTAALRLEITPQINEETGEVQMHVIAENNTVDFSLANQFNNGTPGINTQSAESTVRVSDGGTTVMGGINTDTEGHTQNRTPGLSRIPIVGELFKHRSTRRDFQEILFFITPRIVRQDGTVGPRLAPQRSSLEGPATTTPGVAQNTSALSTNGKKTTPKTGGTPQAGVSAKGGQ